MTLLGTSVEMVIANPYEAWLLYFSIVFGIGFFFCMMGFIINDEFSCKYAIYLAMLCIICIGSACWYCSLDRIPQDTYYYQISDDVSYKDIVDKYDVIEQHGDLIVLRDKENDDG